MGEGSSEVGVGILGILLNHTVEVKNGFLVLVDHLVGLGSLVDVSNIALHQLNALREGEDRLLELLLIAVGQTDVVIQVSLVGQEGFILKRTSKHLNLTSSLTLIAFLNFLFA